MHSWLSILLPILITSPYYEPTSPITYGMRTALQPCDLLLIHVNPYHCCLWSEFIHIYCNHFSIWKKIRNHNSKPHELLDFSGFQMAIWFLMISPSVSHPFSGLILTFETTPCGKWQISRPIHSAHPTRKLVPEDLRDTWLPVAARIATFFAQKNVRHIRWMGLVI